MAENITADSENGTSNTTTTAAADDYYLFHGYGVVVPLAIFMIAFMILAVVGNVMVIMTIVRHRGMRTRTNMFIVNLAVADILVAVLDMPVSLITILEGQWIFGDALCQFNGFTMALFLICSIHTLMYISIHKYISITRPFSRAMTPRRIKMMIAAAWLWSLICATAPLLKWNKIEFKKGSSQCGPAVPMTMSARTHSLFITTSNYIIPLMVMCFCYYRIFREIHDHMTRIRETSNIDLESSVAQQKKVSVTLFWVLACFLICWTPFVVYSTALAFMKDKSKMPEIVNPLAYWCGYMNSACNPIIYAFRSPSFRQGYKEIMCGVSSRLSGANSLSFRSRSGRGSTRSNSHFKVSVGHLSHRESNKIHEREHKRRPRKMLSQTSWASLPLIPYIMRSLSRNGSSQHRVNRQISENNRSGISQRQASIPEETHQEINSSETDKCMTDEQERTESFNNLGDDHRDWEDKNGRTNKSSYESIELDVIPETDEGQTKMVSGNGNLNDSKRSLEKSSLEDEDKAQSTEEAMEEIVLQEPDMENSAPASECPLHEMSIKV